MFCSNCGKEIADGAKFCKYCGFSMDESADIKNEISSVNHTEIATAHNTEMDRGALLLYLQNVRNLEVARYVLKRKHRQRQREYEDNLDYYGSEPCLLKYPNIPWKDTDEYAKGAALIFFALAMFGVNNLLSGKADSMLTGAFNLMTLVWAIIGIVIIAKAVYKNNEREGRYKYECNEISKENDKRIREAKERQKRLPAINVNWNAECEEYERNVEKIGNVLTSFYDMNIIAKEYRGNLAATQYIYEVAESTQLSYEQICLQMKMEDGIRRVESKLNEIVNKVEDLIFETRCAQAQQNEIANSLIEKNNKMLKTLQQTEQNSALTAQYAQLASNYAEANAYFSLATYLKD